VSARPRPLIGPLIAGLALLLAALSGCGTGQVAQTARHEDGVNGASGQAGPIVVRGAEFPFPSAGEHFYRRGSSVPLQLTIVNTAGTSDRLAAVQSQVAGSVQLSGQTTIAGRSVARAVPGEASEPGAQPTTTELTTTTTTPAPTTTAPTSPPAPTTTPGQPTVTPASPTTPTSPASSTSPSTPTSTPELAQGELLILLVDLTGDIRPGRTVRVVLVFENAGEVALDVPIAAPEEPRGESAH
jgi:copper(I)-binding protein